MERRTFRNETSSPLFSFSGPSASSSFSFFLRYNHFSLGLTCSSVCFTSLNGRIIDLESEKGSAGVNQLYYILKEEFFSKYFSLVVLIHSFFNSLTILVNKLLCEQVYIIFYYFVYKRS